MKLCILPRNACARPVPAVSVSAAFRKPAARWNGARIAPIAALAALAAVAMSASAARAGSLHKNQGMVQVGFLGTPPQHFQHVLLNVIDVRINPNFNAGPSDPKWQVIPVAPGVTGGSGGVNSGDLQVDLNTIQNVPLLVNSAPVRPESGECNPAKGKPTPYAIAELDLDPTNPGTLIPFCAQAGTPEGCISYPIQLNNVGSPIVTPICFNVSKGQTSALYLNVQLSIVPPVPPVTGGTYKVTVTINPADASAYFGQVCGTIVGLESLKPLKHVRDLSVTAEAAGTGTIIQTVPVSSTSSGCGPLPTAVTTVVPTPTGEPTPTPTAAAPSFNMQLPAAGQAGETGSTGTYYDLYVSGGEVSYDAVRLPLLFGKSSIPQDLKVEENQPFESVAGTVTDSCDCIRNCNGFGTPVYAPIVGATVELLRPPDGTNLSADCAANPGECIVVASGSTDDSGHFPLPGTAKSPAPLDSVPPPLVMPRPSASPTTIPYTLMVSASGYDTAFMSPVIPGNGKNGAQCAVPGPNPSPVAPCEISMTTGYVSGTIQATAPMGGSIMANVFAEQTGTNNLVGVSSTPIILRAPNWSRSYSVNVPTGAGNLDLFASTIDFYQGASDPYPGHTIETLSNITAPKACANSSMTANFVEGPPYNNPLSCVGHGSIIGTASSADLGTSVVLSKKDPSGNLVQIGQTAVQNVHPSAVPSPSPLSNNEYSFCAPANVPGESYTIQRYELPSPEPSVVPSVVPTPAPAGPQVSVTIPAPALINTPTPTSPATPLPTPSGIQTPCPTICSNSDGSCPGTCLSANQNL